MPAGRNTLRQPGLAHGDKSISCFRLYFKFCIIYSAIQSSTKPGPAVFFMISTVLALLTLFLLFVTLLPLSRATWWWVRVWDFPRLQLSLLLFAVLVADLALLDLSGTVNLLISITSALCFIYQLWWIVPYTKLFPAEVKKDAGVNAGSSISVLAANVLRKNRNASALIDITRRNRPDILVTMESDKWWEEQLEVLEKEYPYTVKCPLDNRYGMHVYSRLKLHNSTIHFLVEPDIPSVHSDVTLPSGENIRLHFVHPAPPSPTEKEESDERDAELLLVGKSIANTNGPVIITGDLNDVAWSATTRLFRKISGLLDPRVGRGMYNTFHAGYWFLRWPLDHLFHSSHFKLRCIKRLPAFGSDHFPILVELLYCDKVIPDQNGLEAEKEDKQLAEKKIKEYKSK